MKLPCPHCGNTESLTDRAPGDIKPIIPEEVQYNFSNPSANQNQYTPTPAQPVLRLSSDVPLESLFPPPLSDAPLTTTEQKLYLQLSLEFRIILDKAKNYQEGMSNWTTVLPDRLQNYGLTRDSWDRIASLGDKDARIQEQLKLLIKKIFS